MSPFTFGPPERRLFGIFHPARVPSATALLLCNPFGQEAIRVHRLFRVLAERLARTGVDVLRFDYFGTGDSAGDDAEGELEGWSLDVLAADSELRQRSSAGAVTWIGARLGAMTAAKATREATRPPNHLVLWEPVVDGAAYLRTLTQSTVDTIQNSLCITDPRWDALLAANAPELHREGVGFEIGERLRSQLLELVPDGLPVPRSDRVTLLHDNVRMDLDRLVERWRRGGAVVDEARLDDDFEWLVEEVHSSALVPPAILNCLAGTAVPQS
jgi:alpha/beta superfamily hydrolase